LTRNLITQINQKNENNNLEILDSNYRLIKSRDEIKKTIVEKNRELGQNKNQLENIISIVKRL
jgi:hypothetical protein